MKKRRSMSDAFRDDEDGTANPLISLQEQADEEGEERRGAQGKERREQFEEP